MQVNYTAVDRGSLIRRKPKIVNAVLLESNIPGWVHLSSNLRNIFASESNKASATDWWGEITLAELSWGVKKREKTQTNGHIFRTRWLINKHWHRCVQGTRSSIQVTFHFYFRPTVFNLFFPLFSFFFKKENLQLKTFLEHIFFLENIENIILQLMYTQDFVWLLFLIKERRVVFLQCAVLQNTNPTINWTEKEEIQTNGLPKNKCMHTFYTVACKHNPAWKVKDLHLFPGFQTRHAFFLYIQYLKWLNNNNNNNNNDNNYYK